MSHHRIEPELRLAMTVEQCWQRVPGGSATYIVELSRELARRPEVHVVGLAARHRADLDPDLKPGFPVMKSILPRRLLYDSWSHLRWPSIIRDDSIDVMHATTWAIPGTRAPLVVTVHDLAFLRAPEHFTARGNRFFRRALEIVRTEASAVIVPSECTARDCIQAGIDADRIHVIPHGVAIMERTEAEVTAFRQRFTLERPYILWCGTLEPRKNVATLLHAFSILSAKNSDLDLVLVGPRGWGDTGLDAEWPTNLDTTRVKLLGRLPTSDLNSAYSGASAFCFPSIWEGFGLPVVEAMAHGIPVVTSSNTSMSEVGGDAVLVSEALDADLFATQLARAIGDESLQLATAGRIRSANFTWANSASEHLQVYRKLANPAA